MTFYARVLRWIVLPLCLFGSILACGTASRFSKVAGVAPLPQQASPPSSSLAIYLAADEQGRAGSTALVTLTPGQSANPIDLDPTQPASPSLPRYLVIEGPGIGFAGAAGLQVRVELHRQTSVGLEDIDLGFFALTRETDLGRVRWVSRLDPLLGGSLWNGGPGLQWDLSVGSVKVAAEFRSGTPPLIAQTVVHPGSAGTALDYSAALMGLGYPLLEDHVANPYLRSVQIAFRSAAQNLRLATGVVLNDYEVTAYGARTLMGQQPYLRLAGLLGNRVEMIDNLGNAQSQSFPNGAWGGYITLDPGASVTLRWLVQTAGATPCGLPQSYWIISPSGNTPGRLAEWAYQSAVLKGGFAREVVAHEVIPGAVAGPAAPLLGGSLPATPADQVWEQVGGGDPETDGRAWDPTCARSLP